MNWVSPSVQLQGQCVLAVWSSVWQLQLTALCENAAKRVDPKCSVAVTRW